MAKFRLNKLVRDNIVKLQLEAGQKPVVRQLDAAEHTRALGQKIIEEVQELLEADQNAVVAEIADVQQALDDLKELYGLSTAEVEATKTKKRTRSGGFKQGLFVETLEVDETDEWIDYYRAHPDRFPEIK